MLKTPLTGLLDRGGVPAFDWMLGYVVNVHWTQLQAAAGGSLLHPNPIDDAVQTVQAFNAARASLAPRGLRLRIFCAGQGWPANMGGPIAVTDPADGASTVVGAFWMPGFINAYGDLQAKLAAAYDAVPEVREVGISMLSLVYDEPFRRYGFAQLLAKGWSEVADKSAFKPMIEAHTVWKETPQFLSFNPYSQPSGGDDETFTEATMVQFRAIFETQGVLMNNSIRSTSMGSLYDSMFAKMKSLGPPISFQTAGSSKIGDPATTIAWAAQQGARSVELPTGYSTWPASTLATMQKQLLANATPATPHRRSTTLQRQGQRRKGAVDRRASSENHAGERRVRDRRVVPDRRNPPGVQNAP